jgi:N-acylneuraminate cytidylyltransferase
MIMKNKIDNLNIVCIIPARGGSKGIPKKNIIDISGQPLISWSIQQALNSKYLKDKVFVSSDCDEILKISKSYEANIIKRPDDISGDKASSESALFHSIFEIEKEYGKIDIIVFLQATSPLRETKDINNAIEKFINNDFDSLFSACELEDFFIWNYDKENKLTSLNYNFLNRKRRQDISTQFVENGSIYVFKPQVLFDNNNRLGGKIGISLMERWKMYEIDNLEDKDLCEYYIKNKRLGE